MSANWPDNRSGIGVWMIEADMVTVLYLLSRCNNVCVFEISIGILQRNRLYPGARRY